MTNAIVAPSKHETEKERSVWSSLKLVDSCNTRNGACAADCMTDRLIWWPRRRRRRRRWSSSKTEMNPNEREQKMVRRRRSPAPNSSHTSNEDIRRLNRPPDAIGRKKQWRWILWIFIRIIDSDGGNTFSWPGVMLGHQTKCLLAWPSHTHNSPRKTLSQMKLFIRFYLMCITFIAKIYAFVTLVIITSLLLSCGKAQILQSRFHFRSIDSINLFKSSFSSPNKPFELTPRQIGIWLVNKRRHALSKHSSASKSGMCARMNMKKNDFWVFNWLFFWSSAFFDMFPSRTRKHFGLFCKKLKS